MDALKHLKLLVIIFGAFFPIDISQSSFGFLLNLRNYVNVGMPMIVSLKGFIPLGVHLNLQHILARLMLCARNSNLPSYIHSSRFLNKHCSSYSSCQLLSCCQKWQGNPEFDVALAQEDGLHGHPPVLKELVLRRLVDVAGLKQAIRPEVQRRLPQRLGG